ncbi:MAG TPA: DNA (cytosine-5-)-methyltransferase [Bacteroidales bacterium]|nr:DNA (cytosine-5-)-methyltransferase [Bacteroidales bacterium]
MNHGSLFSGIGGFDLAAEWMWWNNVFQVEKDDWCRKVLAKNFPKTERFVDIKDFTGHEYTNRIDVISGGFPCQPFSVAGQRKGKDDDRYIWEEMLRVIATIKPTWVIGENVTGIIGLALDTVLSDLENQGYETETYIIPACGKNALHRRDRVWIIAHSNHGRNLRTPGKHEIKSREEWGQERNEMEQFSKSGGLWVSAYAATSGFSQWGSKTMVKPEQKQKSERRNSVSSNSNNTGCEEQRQPITDGKELFAPKCSGWWETEPGVGRVVNGLPNRVDRIKGLGNAIVPQIAYEIFKAIANTQTPEK